MSDQKKKPDDNALNNPFKVLKGLSVSGMTQAAAEGSKDAAHDTKQDHVADDANLFEKEMGWIGVKRLGGDNGSTGTADGQADGAATSAADDQAQGDDAELFRQALDDLDQVIKDETAGTGPGTSAPRRSRLLRLGRVRPEAELDLHGMTREEALAKVRTFLENAHYHGFKIVLIITGKGDRNQGGAVLRQAVAGYLSQGQDRVQEWMVAPRQYGGSGALVVFLR
jgi:DNA-nicking Smr family endonuclease